jgi:hypothetical protein
MAIPKSGIITVKWLKEVNACHIPRWFKTEYPRGLKLTRRNLRKVAKHYRSKHRFPYELPYLFFVAAHKRAAGAWGKFSTYRATVGEDSWTDRVDMPVAQQIEILADQLGLP